MSNEQNESDAKAHPVDTLVTLLCACGWKFTRSKELFKEYESVKLNSNSVLERFYERKIKFCDKCMEAKMRRVFELLPEVIGRISSPM
jgi:hypothetical protein